MKRFSIHTIIASCLVLAACDSGNEADVKADAAKPAEAAKSDAADKKVEEAKTAAPIKEAAPDPAAEGPKMSHVAMATHEVEDFDAWMKGYAAGAGARASATGATGEFVFQDPENPKLVTVVLGGNEPDRFKSFLASEDLKKAMADAGVKGEPEVSIWELKDMANAPDPTAIKATVLIRHEVETWDKFKTEFASGAAMMADAGVVGWGTAVNADNANEVGVRLDTADVEKTKAFLGSEELKTKMAAAGVNSEPVIQWMAMVQQPGATDVAEAGVKAAAAVETEKKPG